MSSKTAKRLVVDTGIARAAGPPEAEYPTAIHCRDFLEIVRKQHRIVMPPALYREWKKHQSGYAKGWLVAMTRRGLVDYSQIKADPGLLERIQATTQEYNHQAIAKDIHLVDAALATDRIVTSLDTKIRGHLSRAASSITELQQICWVNPDAPDEQPIEWLKAGAKHEQQRLLGYQTPEE